MLSVCAHKVKTQIKVSKMGSCLMGSLKQPTAAIVHKENWPALLDATLL